MSRPLISRSADLQRLRDEGYQSGVTAGHLVMEHVPYVTGRKEVRFGTLVSTLSLAGDKTTRPQDHQAYFVGEPPCHKDGSPLSQITTGSADRNLGGGIIVNVSFSTKPPRGYYEDYYEKMTTYAAILAGPAQALDPEATARTGRAMPSEGDEETVFNYLDTASSRAGIGASAAKFRGQKVAIVGVGGTGSYVLDLVAKTPVAEIHLFDADEFEQHNAFRAPGAAAIDELEARPLKVEHFARVYSRMRKGVIAHPYRITEESVAELNGLDFVFLCMDKGSAKRSIVEHLEERGASFMDVGMGVEITDDARLLGIVRVTTSTPEKRDHLRNRVGFTDAHQDNEYERNIQIADLNCLNAALAVIKWKKLCGFYADREREHSSTYTIDVNMLLSEDLS